MSTATTYSNPILDADWPDLDAIRVGETYFLVASSINRVPGLPILASPDLINWRLIGHALGALEPADHFTLPRHGAGAWAPAIRHHDGLFYIFVPDPDHGISVVTASDPSGPWSRPRLIMPGLGLIDPCPLWDDDGRVWMVFGWARSRSGVANRLSIVQLTPDATAVAGTPFTVIDADDLPGYSTLEGPKFYKRDGWYWIFAPAGGVTNGWQSVFRSRTLEGPYEGRIVLESGDTRINGPHQGAWVTSPEGEDWFLHFQDRGVFGRVTHLQPMRWGSDGWPVMGDAGQPVLESALPARAFGTARERPDRDDDFSSTHLSLQWHWQANPADDWLELRGDGRARLAAVPNDVGSLRSMPQVLGQQLPGQPVDFSTSLSVVSTTPGLRAGVTVLGTTYAWLGILVDQHGAARIVAGQSDPGGETRTDLGLVADGERVALRVRSDVAGVCALAFARAKEPDQWVDGITDFRATPGHWISAELGLFAASGPGSATVSTAVFGPVAFTDR